MEFSNELLQSEELIKSLCAKLTEMHPEMHTEELANDETSELSYRANNLLESCKELFSTLKTDDLEQTVYKQRDEDGNDVTIHTGRYTGKVLGFTINAKNYMNKDSQINADVDVVAVVEKDEKTIRSFMLTFTEHDLSTIEVPTPIDQYVITLYKTPSKERDASLEHQALNIASIEHNVLKKTRRMQSVKGEKGLIEQDAYDMLRLENLLVDKHYWKHDARVRYYANENYLGIAPTKNLKLFAYTPVIEKVVEDTSIPKKKIHETTVPLATDAGPVPDIE